MAPTIYIGMSQVNTQWLTYSVFEEAAVCLGLGLALSCFQSRQSATVFPSEGTIWHMGVLMKRGLWRMNFALVPFTCLGEVLSGVLPRLGVALGLGLPRWESVCRWILISGVASCGETVAARRSGVEWADSTMHIIDKYITRRQGTCTLHRLLLDTQCMLHRKRIYTHVWIYTCGFYAAWTTNV